MTGKVLVLGDDTRSFLAIVRSLGRRGLTVHAAPANFRSPALRSRYIAAIRELPPWLGDGAEWVDAVAQLLRAERYDLVIPCNETTLLPLQRHRALLSRWTMLAIPDDRAIAALFDKHETRKLAQQLGIPIAPGRLAREDDTAAELFAEFGTPIVVKPRHSYSLECLASRGEVHVVADQARLAQLLRDCDPDETVIEQFFSGDGIGVSVLASHGRLLQAFQHHRAREIGGAAFYRYAAPLALELVQACAAIVARLEYTGVAMFEFKRDAAGNWILLEVNARPWGSMPLPVALGVDFPYRWYRLLCLGEESPPVSYPIGVYGRNLLPDLHNSLIEAGRRGLGRLATMSLILGRLAEMTRLLTGREVHDVLVRDDWRPGLVELFDFAARLCRRQATALPGAATRRRKRALAQISAAQLGSAPQCIIFVCQGNICRSPFAAALLRARLADREIRVCSAGMMPRPGRSTPKLGLAAAAVHGIDLSPHRSVWLTRQMIEKASLLIVFDEINKAAVRDRYPDLRVPLILLGDLIELGEIGDPVDGSAADFALTYQRISVAIDELVVALRNAGKTRKLLSVGSSLALPGRRPC